MYSTDAGGGVASLLLNRPQALHALNINMIRLLSEGLKVRRVQIIWVGGVLGGSMEGEGRGEGVCAMG